MTAIARDQFKIKGPVVRHLPTGARFTKGSNVIDWGNAGDRLTNGDQFARRDVMHTALQILDEIAETGGRALPASHRRLERRRAGEALAAAIQVDDDERPPQPAIFSGLFTRGKPPANSDEGETAKTVGRSARGRLSRQLVIIPLCAVALGVWSFELSVYLQVFDFLAAYMSPQALNPLPNIPCCTQWYVLR